jgi:hypothetical protein
MSSEFSSSFSRRKKFIQPKFTEDLQHINYLGSIANGNTVSLTIAGEKSADYVLASLVAVRLRD